MKISCSLFSSLQSLSRVWLCDPMNRSTAGLPVHHQHLKFTQTHVHWVGDAIQPSHPLLFPSPPALNLPQHQGLSSESILLIRWPKYWNFGFNISPTNEHPELISFRMDWLDLLAVQGTLKSLLQCCSSKASILQCSAFFRVWLSHPYMTTGKPPLWLWNRVLSVSSPFILEAVTIHRWVLVSQTSLDQIGSAQLGPGQRWLVVKRVGVGPWRAVGVRDSEEDARAQNWNPDFPRGRSAFKMHWAPHHCWISFINRNKYRRAPAFGISTLRSGGRKTYAFSRQHRFWTSVFSQASDGKPSSFMKRSSGRPPSACNCRVNDPNAYDHSASCFSQGVDWRDNGGD